MFGSKLHSQLEEVLACPACRGTLRIKQSRLVCQNCVRQFEIKNGVPVFIAEPVVIASPDHTSNPLGGEYETILREGRDFVLHIGAGSSASRFPNCIELEHQIFRHTDVVGDAHQLPFRKGVFDRVFAFNVFEHLREPKNAAAEIFRVLKPGGSVTIHTAFLQSLHEEPHHFYNATEYGVREWFSPFEIEACQVSGNFGPGVMLGFLMSNVVETARQGGADWKDLTRLSDTTIGEWAQFWGGKSDAPQGFAMLQNLPQPLQKRVAAGFELLARKPAAAAG